MHFARQKSKLDGAGHSATGFVLQMKSSLLNFQAILPHSMCFFQTAPSRKQNIQLMICWLWELN